MANDIDKTSPHYKGEFGSIYEVNQKFPSGGVEGDYVAIDGWAHYWNADRGTWCVNAQRDSYWDELITGIIEKFKLIKGATYMGVAGLDTVPAKAIGAKMYYFATVAGTYKNFGGLVVPQGINVLYSENGSSWVCSTLLEVAQELGVSTRNVVSQKVVNEALAKKADKETVDVELGKKANTADVDTKFTEEKKRVDAELGKKFDKESVAQEAGDSEELVMSQKAVSTELSNLQVFSSDLSKDITCISLKNRIIKGNLVSISTGKLNPSAEYDCTDFIPVNKSIYTTLPDMGSAVVYDSDKKYIKTINAVTEHGLAKYVYDDDTIAYIRINQHNGNTELSYDNSYAIKADFIGNVCLGVEANSYNELYGKKWCCCGDSFSVAGYNSSDGIPQDVYVYQDGPYKGKQKVYGTMIALRNSMNFVNIANGGMTMCNIDGTRTNSFTYNDYYKKIPLDSDYVTIKFGINDGNFNSPIGTIDDEVVTTFYGAWNVVLKWIRNNLPFTKVGIIVSSGLGKTQSSDNLAEATRNVAQKWGIPILDEINDKTIPLLHRTNRPGISSDVYDLLIEKFSVNTATGNTHPNVKAHEFESTFVEAFIRKL